MEILVWISRLASVAVAIGYLIAAGISDGWQPDDGFLGFILLAPVALIWFPDLFGSYLGPFGRGHIDHETPPFLVASAGWFFLVGLPLIIHLLDKSA